MGAQKRWVATLTIGVGLLPALCAGGNVCRYRVSGQRQSRSGGGVDGVVVNECANGGPFGIDFKHLTSYEGVSARWTFVAPSGTRISGVRVGKFWGSGGSEYSVSILGDDLMLGLPAIPEADSTPDVPFRFTGLSTRFVTVELRCSTRPGDQRW
jgi:hypothetical protein